MSTNDRERVKYEYGRIHKSIERRAEKININQHTGLNFNNVLPPLI